MIAQGYLEFDGHGNLTERQLDGPSVLAHATAQHIDAAFGAYVQEQITTQGQPGTITWNLFDNLDSVRDVVNNSGAVVDHIVYTSFGQIYSDSAPSTSHLEGFQGSLLHANTGLDLFDNRWYDPATGQWLREDPLSFAGGDTDLHRFLCNSVVDGFDPSGLGFWSIVGSFAAGVLIGAATAVVIAAAAPAFVAGLVAVGVSATVAQGAVTVGLAGAALVGGVTTGLNTIIAVQEGNYEAAAFNVGALVGGGLVGINGGGRYVATAIPGTPSGAPYIPGIKNLWTSFMQNLQYSWANKSSAQGPFPFFSWSFWATGPDPLGGGTALGLGASGAGTGNLYGAEPLNQ